MKLRLGWTAACIAAAALLPLSATAAFAAPGQATVSYLGRNFAVPTSWPIVDLVAHPGTCVRFDRHALYLGTPSPDQDCPGRVIGRTEAVLVEPVAESGASTTTDNPISQEITASATGVKVTATYDRDPALVRGILAAAGFAANGPSAVSPPTARTAVTPAAISTSATTYTGKGFDACTAPSASAMNAWLASPYRAIGIYIGGADRGCAQPNLTADWVSAQAQAGWHFIPLYVGPQASVGQITSPTSQGTSAADDAANQAAALGFGQGNPIYYDMEAYGSNQSAAALAFESAWTAELHNRGYQSGYYSSSSSGIADLVANYSNYNMPDIIHVANWNGVASTDDPAVPSNLWANHQRIHQYTGPGTESYGGVEINIDHDYLDVVSGSVPLSGGNAYTPLGPVRVLDTRAAIGVSTTTAVQPGQTVSLRVAGVDGVPATGVTAVALNVTVTAPSSSGVLTVYPDGLARPVASNLNWVAGQTVPNQVIVPVVNGTVDFFNNSPGTVHLVADLGGYFSRDPTASGYTPVTPARVLDTRAAIGVPTTTPVQPGQTVPLQIAGAGGVPASGVTAVALNVTVTAPTSSGVLTVYPDGQNRPTASNMNWVAGQTVPNLVIVPVVNGTADFFNNSPGTVHLVADVAGYFSHDATAGTYTPVAPLRVLDTRAAIGIATTTALASGQTVTLQVAGLPASGVTAVVLNVTVTQPSSSGVLTVYPDDPRPLASNLNWVPGQTVPNLVVVPVVNGTVKIFNNSPGTVHVVADLAGFFSS